MKEIWITTKELAVLSGKDIRTVRRHAAEYISRYSKGRGKSGVVLEYELSSLPKEVQEKYYRLNNIPLPGSVSSTVEYESEYNGTQKQKALTRLGIVHSYLQANTSAAKFVRDYNNCHSDMQISEWKLRDWVSRYESSGRSLDSLIDHRGENRKGSGAITSEMWTAFLELKLAPQGRSVQLCYDLLCEEHPGEDIPSVKCFERKYSQIAPVIKIAAKGVKDRLDRELPSLYRDYSQLESNELWSLDHHLSDVFVRNKKGDIVRLWMTAALDVRSRKIMSMVIRDQEPDKVAIKKGLRIAIKQYGTPKMLQSDNGKDYLSKDLDPNESTSLLAMLGIEKTVAIPKHGQSKPVERFFETMEERFGKRCYGYAGNNAKHRPDYLHMTNKKLKDDPNIMSMDEFIEACQNWINDDYAKKIHRGDGMNGRTVDEVYSAEMGEIRRFDDDMRLAIICGEHEERTVQHCCINMYGRTYRPLKEDISLINYNGKRVTLRYLPENIDVLYLYDEQGRYVCTVTAVVRTPFRSVTMEDYKAVRREQKLARRIIKEQMPKARLSVIDSLINKQVEEINTEQADISAPNLNESETAPERRQNSFAYFGNEYSANKKEVI